MFSKLCIRKPVTTIMVTLMVFIAGIVSYFNLDHGIDARYGFAYCRCYDNLCGRIP